MKHLKNINNQSGLVWLAPILASIGTAFSSLLTYLATFLTLGITSAGANLATKTLVYATYAATFYAMYTGIEACVNQMKSVSFGGAVPSAITTGASWIMPPNTQEFITCIVTIMFIEMAFKYKDRLLKIFQP